MPKFSTQEKTVPLVAVEPNKWNPNVQNDEVFSKLKKSIEQHGFTTPILVRTVGTGWEIIDGEHRYRACLQLGFSEIKILDIGIIDDSTAKLMTEIANNLRGKDDILKQAQMLKEMNDGQLTLLPWDKEEIENRLKLLEFNWDQYNKQDEVQERKEYTVSFALTKAQNEVVQHAIKLTERDHNGALMKFVKEFLEIRENMDKYGKVFD